jgi:hypothetical protein
MSFGTSDDELNSILGDPRKIREARRRTHNRRNRNKDSDTTKQREIFNNSPDAQEDLRKEFEWEIGDELEEHSIKMANNDNVSPMIPIPPRRKLGGIKLKTKRKRSLRKNKKSNKKRAKRKATRKSKSNKSKLNQRKTRRSNKKQ